MKCGNHCETWWAVRGGIFHPEDNLRQDVAFKYAVDRINMDKTVLPHTTLVPVIVNVSVADSFAVGRRVCNMAGEGVAAIFGPHSETSAGIVRGICDSLEIPNLETYWEVEPKPERCLLNLHPDPRSMSRSIADVLKNILHWKSFVILYENYEGLIRLQEVLKAHGPDDNPVTVRQLTPGEDNRVLLKEIQSNQISYIILDCEVENIRDYLRQAKEVKMFGEYSSYFITSLNTHTVDLSEFNDHRVNITSLRLVDPNRSEVVHAVQDWKFGEARYGNKLGIESKNVMAETALMYDAVHLFANALHKLGSSQHFGIKKLNCKSDGKWQHGFALRNYMKVIQINGMTGLVKFDDSGRRVDFDLDIVEFTRTDFLKIGTWDLEKGVQTTRSSSDIDRQVAQNLQNETLIVSSRIGLPYLEWKMPKEGRVGNDRFEGYSIDLISKMADILEFKFEFRITADNSYPGLVEDLLMKKADLAICDLTITKDREEIVDFTSPFMDLGISILFAKPTLLVPSLFSFLDPLSTEVWLFMVTAYLGISILLFVLARATPAEWSSPHPCLSETQELTSKITITNSLWHNVGSLMQQGSDIAPQAVSTRAVAAMWWFFILIMISSYTANLAASLTVTRMDNAIESVDDLAKQTKIKYGTVKKGSTRSFFEKSNNSIYQRIYSAMAEARPTVFVKDNDEGVDRVKKGKGKYAFFMESTQIEYATERNCNLTKIGGLLDSKSYGIAMQRDYPYRTLLNGAVLLLQENGALRDLKNKWWKEMYGGGSCKTSTEVKKDSMELGMPNVGGVFLVLLVGCVTALFVAILEMLWNCRKIAVEEAITPWEALILEVKFAIKMSETKPIRKRSAARMDKNEMSSSIILDFDKYPSK